MHTPKLVACPVCGNDFNAKLTDCPHCWLERFAAYKAAMLQHCAESSQRHAGNINHDCALGEINEDRRGD